MLAYFPKCYCSLTLLSREPPRAANIRINLIARNYRVVPKIGTIISYGLTIYQILTDFQNSFTVRIRRKLVVTKDPATPRVSLHYLVSYKSTTMRHSSFKGKTYFLKHFTYLQQGGHIEHLM